MLSFMKTQAALHLFQYWNRLRSGMPAPRRAQIEPSDIRDILSQTFILESVSHSCEMSFRLAGTAISTLFGQPLRNANIRSLFQEKNVPVINRLMRNCYQDRSVVVLELNASSRTGRHTLLEVIMVPLQDERGGHRILGCIAPHQHQFWHGLDPVNRIDLHSIRIVDPEREPLFLMNRPKVDILPSIIPSEHQLQFEDDTPSKKGVKLLVIQGGKSA
jgi:hypothetical protein